MTENGTRCLREILLAIFAFPSLLAIILPTLAQGGTLHIRITPKDNSGKVSLNLPEDSPKNIDLRLMQTHVTQMPVIYPDHTIPNTEYANWNAVIKAANKARPIVPDFSLDDS